MTEPRPFGEFRRHDDDERERGRERPGGVHHERAAGAGAAGAAPVHDHAELRHGEREERAYGEERDEAVGDAAEGDQEGRGDPRQGEDAAGIDEAPPPVREARREVLVEREQPADPREVREARVGGQREHAEDRAHGDEVEPPPSGDGADDLRDDALVARLARLGRADAVGLREQRDAEQQHHQDRRDGGQRPPGAVHLRLAEDRHGVADRFHSGQRRTPAGECPQEEPQARGGGRRREPGRRHDGRGMAVREHHLPGAEPEGEEQRGDEQIGGEQEGEPRLANASQVDDREQRQDAQAERKRIGEQARSAEQMAPIPAEIATATLST